MHAEEVKEAVVARELISADEFLDFLRQHDRDFEPPLTTRADLTEYALKITTKGEIITARIDGKLVGVGAFYCNNYVTRQAYFSILCVSRHARGMGLGGRLFQEAVRYSQERGMQSMELRTDQHRPDLIRRYERFGFRVFETIPRFGDFFGVRMVQEFSDNSGSSR